MKITVGQYYREFISLQGVIAGAPFIPPLLHVFIPESTELAEYLYPPLGDIEWIAVAATIGILVMTTFVVFSYCDSTERVRQILPALLLFGMALGVCTLIALYVLYVRRIPVPSVNLEVPVSIGYHRTDFAFQNYPGWTDWAMLHDVGPIEEQIQKLWTPRSIWIVRALLWISYNLCVGCFLSVVSLAVYRHAAEKALARTPRRASKEAVSCDNAEF